MTVTATTCTLHAAKRRAQGKSTVERLYEDNFHTKCCTDPSAKATRNHRRQLLTEASEVSTTGGEPVMNTLIRGDYYGRGGKELDVNVSRPDAAVPATAAAGATPSPVPAAATAAGGAMHSLSLSASEQAAQSRLMNNNSQNVAELLRSVDQQPAGLERSGGGAGGGGARRAKQKRGGRANAVARNVLLQGLRASHLTPTQKEDYLRMYTQGFRPNTMQCGSCGDARGGVLKGALGAAARQGGVLRRMKRAELRADTAQRHRKLDAEYWSQLDTLNRKRGLNCKTQDSVYSKLDGVFAPVALAMSDHAHHVHLHDSLVRREAAEAAAAAQSRASVPAPGAQPKAAAKAAAAEPLAAVAAVPAAAAEVAASDENPNAELCDIRMDFDMGTPPGSPPHAASQQAGLGSCDGLLRALDATANTAKAAAVTSEPPQRGRLRKHLAGLRQDGKLIGHSTGLTHEQVAVSLGNAPSVQGAAAASAEAAAAEASLAASNAAVVGGAKVARAGSKRRARSRTAGGSSLLAGFVGDSASTDGGAGRKAKEIAAEFYRRLYAPQGGGNGGGGAGSAASCANTITTAKSSSLSLAGGQKIHFVDHSKNRGAWRNPYVIADQRVPVVPVLP